MLTSRAGHSLSHSPPPSQTSMTLGSEPQYLRPSLLIKAGAWLPTHPLFQSAPSQSSKIQASHFTSLHLFFLLCKTDYEDDIKLNSCVCKLKRPLLEQGWSVFLAPTRPRDVLKGQSRVHETLSKNKQTQNSSDLLVCFSFPASAPVSFFFQPSIILLPSVATPGKPYKVTTHFPDRDTDIWKTSNLSKALQPRWDPGNSQLTTFSTPRP